MVRQTYYSACIVLLASITTNAFQLPLRIPGFGSQDILTESFGHKAPLRVAIIGAGASGSSAAFWIAQAKKRHGVEVEVDIYEKSDHVGGSESLTLCAFINLWNGIQKGWFQQGVLSYIHMGTNQFQP